MSIVSYRVAVTDAEWHPALCIYRGMFLIILFIFLLGLNTYGWRSSGVNHVLIFELDPRNHLNHQQLLEVLTLSVAISARCGDSVFNMRILSIAIL